MRSGCVSASIAHIRPLTRVGTLVVVFSLVRGERFVTAFVAACIGSVASVAEQMTRKLGTLLKVFGGSLAGIPLTETVCAVVDVGTFDVLMQGFGGVEEGEA